MSLFASLGAALDRGLTSARDWAEDTALPWIKNTALPAIKDVAQEAGSRLRVAGKAIVDPSSVAEVKKS